MNTVKLSKGGKTTVVNSKWKKRFEDDGWSVSGEKPKDPESTQVSVSELAELIESSTSKDDIEAIVLDAKGIDIDKRGGLDAVKKKAIAALTGESDEG